jgi:DNA-binding GntR family transcriptional regulator
VIASVNLPVTHMVTGRLTKMNPRSEGGDMSTANKAPSGMVRTQAWEVAYEYLRVAILSEELKPGERLVETAIAERLGMSQGPLREALARLGEQGLVTVVGRRGRYVTEVPVEAGRTIYELRSRVEPLAARMALQHIQPEDLVSLEHHLEDMKNAENVAARVDADMAFHRCIYKLANFPPLLNLWDQMELYTRRLRPLSTPKLNYEVHKAILEALSARDGDRTDHALEVHMRDTWSLREADAGSKHVHE